MHLGHVVCIVQARMGSQRLPGKILIELDKYEVYQWVYHRLKSSRLINKIVFATTTNSLDDEFVVKLKNESINYYRGDEQDVLSRYYTVASLEKADTIVRVTCDCPLIDSTLIDKGLLVHKENSMHYTSNVIPPTFPDGFDFEIFSFEILESAHKKAKESQEREHVTTWIIKKTENRKNSIQSQENYGNFRVTLDTPEDLVLLRKLICDGRITKSTSYEEILAFLISRPDLTNINKHWNVRS